jgi:membrane protease subunit (stomatin/prohibitin family)
VEYSKEVVFRGQSEDVIWRSDTTVISTDTKIYSRRDCDIVIYRKGGFVAAFDDKNEYNVLSEEKTSLFDKFARKKSILDDCEIYYINKFKQLENKWGTATRIDFYDKEYDMHTSVGGNGTYRFSINNPMKLLSKILGYHDRLSQQMVRDFFRSELNMHIRNAIAKVFQEHEYSLKDSATIISLEKDVSDQLHRQLTPLFGEYGVKLDKFIVAAFMFDTDFLEKIRSVKQEAIIKRVARDAEADVRQEEKENLTALSEAIAKINASDQSRDTRHHDHDAVKYCPVCGNKIKIGDKFCSECGNRIENNESV